MLLGSSASGGQISLGVRFYLNDQFSTPVRNMRTALQGYRGEFQAFQENLRAARNVALGVAAAGAMATKGLYSAAMEGAEFLYIMKGVEAITEGTNQQMADLNTLAIKLGRETMFMPEDIASGMRFMAMAGQDALVIKKTMAAFTDLAGATMTTLGGKMGAADIGTNALKAFGWEAERSTEMADILVAATTNANVSLVDLGNSIRYVAATSRNLQVPVQETIGLLMSLGNAGIQSSMAGTALENMYRYLARSVTSNASKKAREAWESMGLGRADITTDTGRFKPMVEILGMMNEAMAGMDPIEIQAIFRNIFGVRGVRGAATIARNLKQAGQFVGMLSDENQIGGTAAAKMKIMMDNLQGASFQLISTWKGLKVAFAESAGKWLIPLMHGLKTILGYITDLIKTPIGGFLARATFGFITLTTIVFGLKAAILSVAYAMKTMTVSVGGMAAASKVAMGFMGMGGYNLAAMSGAGARVGATSGAVQGPIPLTRNLKSGVSVVSAGRYGNRYRQGSRFIPKTAAFKAAAPLTKVMKTLTPAVRSLGGVLRGVLSFLGPIGIGIAALSIFGPMIYSALTRNSDAVEANSRALMQSHDAPMDPELYAMISSKNIGELMETILEKMTAAIERDSTMQEIILAKLENDSNFAGIAEFLISAQGSGMGITPGSNLITPSE